MPKGEKNKLTAEQKEEINSLKNQESAYKIAKRFNVSHTMVYKIWKKDTSNQKKPFFYGNIRGLSQNIAGIYAIIDIETNRTYVGASINIRTRLLTHLAELKRKSHINYDLQKRFNEVVNRGWNPNGYHITQGRNIEGFDFCILQEFKPSDSLRKDLLKEEKYWIDSFDNHFNRTKIKSIDTSILKVMIPVFVENELKVKFTPEMEQRVIKLIQEVST